MNAVMSLWTKPCLDGKAHGYSSVETMIESLIVSSNVAKKHYPNLYFYTDKIGYEWIEPYLDKLPFTKIEICLDEMNWVDDNYWSIVKVFVYTLQKEPFVHLDNDVFLWDKLPDELCKNDFFFQEIEWFHEMGRDFYVRGLEVYKDAVPKEIEVLGAAFNCGIFGCGTQKSLELLDEYYKHAYYFVKNTKNLKNLDFEESSKRWLATVIIEQVFIYSLVVGRNYSYDVLLHHKPAYVGYDKKYNIKYTHTLAHHKRNPLIENKIKERVMLNDWNA
jgi:hypothetical protein